MAFDAPSRKRDDALHPLEKKTLFLPLARSRPFTFKDRDFPSSIVLLFCCNIYLLEARCFHPATCGTMMELGLCSREREKEREANGFHRFVSFRFVLVLTELFSRVGERSNHQTLLRFNFSPSSLLFYIQARGAQTFLASDIGVAAI